MTYSDRFSTSSFDPSERLATWNRLSSEMYREQLVVTPRPGSAFGASLLCQSYGYMTIARVTTTPATLHSEPWETGIHEPEYAGVVLQDAGTIVREMNGRQTLFLPGTLAVCNHRQPYTLSYDDTARCIGVWLPVERLAARIGNPARLAATRVDASEAALLANFLRTITVQGDPAEDSGYDEAIEDVILDLIAITYQHRTAPSPASTASARWRQEVLDLVERHLEDPELGAPMLARRLGVTPAEVQLVFAQLATTASEYILYRRLELPGLLQVDGSDPVSGAVTGGVRRLQGPLPAPRRPAVRRTSRRRRSS